MFLNDALQNFRRRGAIPHAFGIHDCDRTAFADAEAIRFRAIHTVEQAEFGETALEIDPRFEANFLCAAFRLGLIAAEEGGTLHAGDVESRGDLCEVLVHPTTAAGFESSPISGMRMLTISPGTSAASCVTMMPVPVSSTVPTGTVLARVRNSTSVSSLRCSLLVLTAPS